MASTNSKHVFMGLYGEPGIGKSRFIGTSARLAAAAGKRVMIIRPAVDHLDSLNPEDKALIEEHVVGEWQDMDHLEDKLRQEGDKYEWVWIDSWSLLQDVLLDDLFEQAKSENPRRGRYGPDKQEYGINMYRIGSWMRHVVGPDLFNFGFTAHPATIASPDLDEDGDPIEKLMPWIQGRNMSPKLCGYMNLVCFLEASNKGRRVLRSQSDARFYAKDGFDSFDKGALWDPTMSKVMDLINNSPGRKKVPAARRTGATPRRRTTTTIKKGSK